MKTMTLLLASFSLLTFSGCYTQLLVEDDPAPVQKARPVIAIPAPVAVNPYATEPFVECVPEQPVNWVPPNNPEPVTGYSNPSGTARQPATVQRTSGDQRTAAAPAQSSSEGNSRSSGTTRGGGR